MATTITNVTNAQSFGTFLERVNQIADVVSTNVVTTALTTGGAITTGNAFVNGMFGSNTVYATYISGGNISSNSVLTVTSNTYVNNYLSVGNANANAVFGYQSGMQSVGVFTASVNNYLQTVTMNINTGSSSSADWIAYNDTNDANVFVDIGINGANWSNTTWTINGANDSYVYSGGGGLAVGTANANPIIMFTGGTYDTNERVRITSTGNVGIGNSTPNAKLAVTGTANISGNVAIAGATRIANSISVLTVNSDLIPAFTNTYSIGNSTFNWKAIYVSASTLYVGDVAVGASGGNLTVPGIVDSGTIAVTGNATFSNMVSVTGNVVLSNTIAVTGNATFSNTVVVTGNSTFSNIVSVVGNATFSNAVAVTGNVSLSNTLAVTGNVTLSNSVAVTGNVTLSNTLAVTGAVTFSNTLTASNTNIVIQTNSTTYLSVGNSSVNTVVNSSVIAVTNVNATNIYGTLQTAAQPNITAGNSTNLNSQPASYYVGLSTAAYTNATSYTDTRVDALSTLISQAGTNASLLTTGTLPAGRLTGAYTGVTVVGTLANLNVTNTVVLANTLSVAGNSTLTGIVTFGNTVGIANNANVGGDLRVSGNLYVTGTSITTSSAAGDIIPTSNGISLGSDTKRFNLYGYGGSFSNNLTVANNFSVTNSVSISNNLTVSGGATVGGTLGVNATSYYTSGKFTTDTNLSGVTQTVDFFPTSSYRSAEYLVNLTDVLTSPSNPSYQTSKLIVMHNDTTAYITEYAQLFNNSLLGTFTADVNTGNVRLRLAPASGNVVVTFVRNNLVI